MMKSTFRGGVHPAQSKDKTAHKPIRRAPLPKRVFIPLSQHTGAACRPLVKAGQAVRCGEKIAESDKFISSPIHASISGTVAKIEKFPHPVLGRFDAILIESDGSDAKEHLAPKGDMSSLPSDEIRRLIKEAGIAGMGGAAFPAHVKLTPPEGKKIDTVILNGAECEPYLTCDHRLMLERGREILEGLKIISKLTGAAKTYIAVESNKRDAAEALRKITGVRVVLLGAKYPQGAEKSLIKAILNRTVPYKGLPFDVGCVVSNVGTALAIYETVFERKPLYERVVTLSGDCLKEPSNLLVRIGTTAGDLAEACGGFAKEPAKVIFGGPMMGIAQYTLDAPVIKGTSGILFLSRDILDESEEGTCIRCGRCLEVCPMDLAPTTLANLVKKERFVEAKDIGLANCFECGACAYECPAKIPLLDYMKFGKSKI